MGFVEIILKLFCCMPVVAVMFCIFMCSCGSLCTFEKGFSARYTHFIAVAARALCRSDEVFSTASKKWSGLKSLTVKILIKQNFSSSNCLNSSHGRDQLFEKVGHCIISSGKKICMSGHFRGTCSKGEGNNFAI